MKKKIGVSPAGKSCWTLEKGKYVRVWDGKLVHTLTPKELFVETLSTLTDLLKNHPDIAVEIQDRLKF